MSEENANRRTVLAYFGEAFVRKRPDRAAEFLAPDYRHYGEGSGGGRSEFVDFFTDYFAHHPDFTAEFLDCLCDRDRFALRVRVRARAADPPHEVAEFYRLRGGDIAEHWHVIGRA